MAGKFEELLAVKVGSPIRRGTELWAAMRAIIRLEAHDTSTEQGRSHERYRRAAFSTFASLGSRAIGLLTSLVSVPLTFHYLGAERYGLWMVLVSFISVLWFADLGIGNGLMNAISEAYGKDDHDLAREYVSSAFGLLTAIAIVLAVAGTIAFPLLPWMRLFNVQSAAVASEAVKALLVLFCWFLVSIPLGIVSRVQAGLQQGYWPQVIGAACNVASLAGLLTVVKLHGSLPWLVLASTLGGVFAALLNGWLLFRQHPGLVPSIGAFRAAAARKILNLGLLFFVLQVAVTLGYSSDNIVITQVLGAAAVAAYAVPAKLFGLFSQLLGMGLGPLWPAYGEAIARGDVAWIRRVFWGSLRAILAITIPGCTALVLLGPWALRVLMGKSLQAPLSLLVVLAVWGVVSGVSTQLSMLLNGASIMKVQTVTAIFASLANLGLSIVFTRRFGMMGVCLGSIIAQVCITLPICSVAIRDFFRSLEISGRESSGMARDLEPVRGETA